MARLTRPLALLVVAALALAAPACGDEGNDQLSPEQAADRARRGAAALTVEGAPSAPAVRHRGPRGKSACQAVRPADVRPMLARAGAHVAALERTKRNSLDLSDCRFHAPGAAAWVTIDRAVDAAKRFWYRMEEQQEFHAADAVRRPQRVKGIGQDATYGGAGAFWTPALNRLIAYRDRTMLIVGFTVPGASDTKHRAGAVRLAKLTFHRLSGDRRPAPPQRLATAPHP